MTTTLLENRLQQYTLYIDNIESVHKQFLHWNSDIILPPYTSRMSVKNYLESTGLERFQIAASRRPCSAFGNKSSF